MKARGSVAIFVPHEGCPHACSFCDQRAISGWDKPPDPAEVRRLLEAGRRTLEGRGTTAEIAFFGGSFTAVEPGYRRALLKAAQPFLRDGGYSGIRVSTRPDAIDGEILRELLEYGVTAIELGAQSMDDKVLSINRRGHTARQVELAARDIRSAGFLLGLQMMTGLPGDCGEGALKTAERLIELKPDTMRVYPTLALKGTYLETLCLSGRYKPQTLEEAVELCAKLLLRFCDAEIPVIRMGLHQSESITERLVAGPHHPAFRELVEGRVLLDKALSAIRENNIPPGPVLITVAAGAQSKMAGQNRRNTQTLSGLGYPAKIKTDESLGYLRLAVTPFQ